MRFKQCVETLCQGSTKAPHLRRQRSGLTRDVEADDGQGLSHTISIVQKRTSRCETGHRQQQQAAASSSRKERNEEERSSYLDQGHLILCDLEGPSPRVADGALEELHPEEVACDELCHDPVLYRRGQQGSID